jgi:hypothetical protein
MIWAVQEEKGFRYDPIKSKSIRGLRESEHLLHTQGRIIEEGAIESGLRLESGVGGGGREIIIRMSINLQSTWHFLSLFTSSAWHNEYKFLPVNSSDV